MRKFALFVVSLVLVLSPASADAKPKHHHDKPVVTHVIDWD